MIRSVSPHIALVFVLSLMSVLIGCSGGSDAGDSSGDTKGGSADAGSQSDVTLVPLSDEIADKLCSLKRYSTVDDLIVRFGNPSERKDAGGMILLRWKGDGWSADAMFSNGQLTLAAANAIQPEKPEGNVFKNHPQYGPGTRLADMESHLGPATRIGVQWHKGIPVAASISAKPDFDDSITRDRCSERYAWTNLDMGGFGSLRFSDGLLQGAL